MEQWAEDGDPDAIVRMQFGEGLVDTVQSDSDMAACINAYVEARKWLTTKAKGRGFLNPSRKGFRKGRKSKGDRFELHSRKLLAQRILEPNCRRRRARKAECPLRQQGSFQESDVMDEEDMSLIDSATRNNWQVVFMSLGHAHTTHVSSPQKRDTIKSRGNARKGCCLCFESSCTRQALRLSLE